MVSLSPVRPQRMPDEVEDIILHKILVVSITPPTNPSPVVTYLELTTCRVPVPLLRCAQIRPDLAMVLDEVAVDPCGKVARVRGGAAQRRDG